MIGIALSIIGLLILTNVEQTGNTWAIGLGLGAAFVWAISSLIVKGKLAGCDMVQYTAWQMVCGAVIMWAYCIFVPQAQVTWTPIGIVMMVYSGLVASALAFLLWNYLLVHMEAGKASIAVMAIPAIGVLCGVVFLHEPMTWAIFIGMIILFAGIILVLREGSKPQRK